jgi:PAS domain S-box-containing protein
MPDSEKLKIKLNYAHNALLDNEQLLVAANEEITFLRDEKAKRAAELVITKFRIEQDEKIIAIVNSSDDVIIGNDLNGFITSWNPGAEKIFGYAAQEVVGHSIEILLPPERLEEELDILKKILQGERISHFETVRLHKDGRRIDVSATISPILNANGKVIGASKIIRDITQNNIINKMKVEFVTTAAHELRTPLTVINGYTELLNMDVGSKDEQQEMLSAIHSQSQAMIHLLNDMLDIARIEAQMAGLYQMELQPIGPCLQTLTASFITPGNHNKITLEMSPNLPEVKVDIAKLEQAIKNCLSNAYKYSPERVEVTMRVTEVTHNKQRKVLIAIEDQGIGMTPEQLERVFEKFYRADPSGAIPGTGLGMSIIKSIIEQHGGAIVIESEYGKGTKVMLYLPVA